MGDLDRGDAKQRIRATGATKNEDTGFEGAFTPSFAAVAAPSSDDEGSSLSLAQAGSGRSAPMPVPIQVGDYIPSGGDFEVPYQIRRAAENHKYMIYLPEGCLVVDGEDVPVSKFSDVGKVSSMKGPWYTYPFTQLLAGYLNVTVEKDAKTGKVTVSDVKFTNGSKASSGNDSSSSSSDKKTKTYSVAISKIDSYSRPVQVVASSIRLTTDQTPETDDKSVETDEEEAKLQLYKFNSSEADGSPGLVQRIKATSDEEGNITLSADDSELMLVCRKNEQIVYIPLSGESDDSGDSNPEEESQEEVDEPNPENIDPATPGAKDPSGDPGSSSGGSDSCGGGGVSPGGGGIGGGGREGYSGCGDC